MSNTWFSSDLHLQHERVAEIRGYGTTLEHDAAIVDIWTSQVGWNDTVYILGDVTGIDRSIPYAMRLLNGLPGTKHLVAGNHDTCNPFRSSSIRAEADYTAFASVSAFRSIRLEGKRVLMSHFPYITGDGYDDRHSDDIRWPEARLRDEGLPLLHGHLHLPVKEHGHQLHCGIDAWDRFVSLGEIAQWVRTLSPSQISSAGPSELQQERQAA